MELWGADAMPREWRAVVVGQAGGQGEGAARLRERAVDLGVGDPFLTPADIQHEQIPSVLAALDAVSWTRRPTPWAPAGPR